jgi:hypothetical protein
VYLSTTDDHGVQSRERERAGSLAITAGGTLSLTVAALILARAHEKGRDRNRDRLLQTDSFDCDPMLVPVFSMA